MAGINGKKKGAKGERMAIEFLRSFTKMDFARTPASGGLRWGKAENIAGDIVCIEKNYIFPFGIEVKFVKELKFNHLLYLGESQIREFWEQCTRDCKRAEKIPMLLMRYNGLPKDFFFVVMRTKFFQELGEMPKPHFVFNNFLTITTTRGLEKISWPPIEKLATRQLLGHGKSTK